MKNPIDFSLIMLNIMIKNNDFRKYSKKIETHNCEICDIMVLNIRYTLDIFANIVQRFALDARVFLPRNSKMFGYTNKHQ